MRTPRLVLFAIASMLVPVTWAALDVGSGVPVSAGDSGLTPDQRMCNGPAKPPSKTIDADNVAVVSCSLTTTVPGTAYVNFSASVLPSAGANLPVIKTVLVVDQTIRTNSSVLLDTVTDESDGSDRNLALQDAVPLATVGAHSFTINIARDSGAGTTKVLNPTIEVYFVPDAPSATPCVTGEPHALLTGQGDLLTVSCAINAPSLGYVRITAGGYWNQPSASNVDVTSRLKVDGNTASTLFNIFDGALAPRLSIYSQQAAAPVAPGSHTVTVELTQGGDATFLEHLSIQAVFIPGTADDTSFCSAAKPEGVAALDGNFQTIVSCDITLPRAGRVQSIFVGDPVGAGRSTGFYTMNIDGKQSTQSTRWVDFYNTSPRLAMQTQFGADLAAGTHTIDLRMAKDLGTSVDMLAATLSVLAVYPGPDDTPATTAPTTAPSTTVPDGGGGGGKDTHDFIPLVPERVLDTRGPQPIGYVGGKPSAGQTVQLQVTGVGTSNVPADAKAVVLNLTGTGAASNGYVTVWPCGAPQPNASNLNVKAGTNVPNLVITKVGDGGKVCLYTQPSQDLVADISGYMPAESSYVPVVPDRVLETRATGQKGYVGAKPAAGDVVQLDVTGVGTSQLPNDASAVVLNVTGTEASGDGYVTVWPCGTPQPVASNLNLVVGTDRPNLVVSKIGTFGKVCLYTQAGAHLLADVNGYLPSGSGYTPIIPVRLLETRAPNQIGYAGSKPAPGAVVQLHVTGDGAAPATATAVVLNVTGTEASGDGYVTVWPCGTAQPTASNLNLTVGATAPNLVMSKIGGNGNICLFTQSGAHLIADLAGYWTN